MTRARDIADLAGGGTLLTRQLFTATAGQTTFTPSAGYNPGALEVFMNGLMLLTSDYTATNSSTVVLGVAANAGDEVEILTYQINTIGDTVSASNGGTFTSDVTVNGTLAATAVTGDGSGLTGVGSPSIDDNGNATAITIDSSENVGIGTSPSSWWSGMTAVETQSSSGGVFASASVNGHFLTNAYYNGSNWKYINSGSAEYYSQTGGIHQFLTATSGTAEANLTWSEHMRIDASGAVTMPSQPAFMAVKNAAQLNMPINVYNTVTFGNEVFDRNVDYNGNTTFTAPITGVYQANIKVRIDQIDNQANYYLVRLQTSNRHYYTITDFDGSTGDLSYSTHSFSQLIDMDAGDTAYVQAYQSGGSVQSDYDNDSGASQFSMFLVA